MDTVIIVILEIGFIATFISLFFFLYVVKVEDEIMTEQAIKITKNLLSDLEFFAPDYARKIRENIKNIDTEKLAANNHIIEEKNKELLDQTVITVVVLVVVCIILALIFYVWKGGNIPNIVFSTICAVAVVALVEFSFVTFIVKNYQTVDPNIIKRAFFEGLNKYINP